MARAHKAFTDEIFLVKALKSQKDGNGYYGRHFPRFSRMSNGSEEPQFVGFEKDVQLF